MFALEVLRREARKLREVLEALDDSRRRQLLDLLDHVSAVASTKADPRVLGAAARSMRAARLAGESVPEPLARGEMERALLHSLKILEDGMEALVRRSITAVGELPVYDRVGPPSEDEAPWLDDPDESVPGDGGFSGSVPEEIPDPAPVAPSSPAEESGGEPPAGRKLSAWLEDVEVPAVRRTARVGFQIGPEVEQALASADFREPEWDDREHLDLLVMLWVDTARVTPNEHTVRLPSRGASEPCFFALTPLAEGRLELRFMIFLKAEGTFLQALHAELETVAEAAGLVGA